MATAATAATAEAGVTTEGLRADLEAVLHLSESPEQPVDPRVAEIEARVVAMRDRPAEDLTLELYGPDPTRMGGLLFDVTELAKELGTDKCFALLVETRAIAGTNILNRKAVEDPLVLLKLTQLLLKTTCIPEETSILRAVHATLVHRHYEGERARVRASMLVDRPPIAQDMGLEVRAIDGPKTRGLFTTKPIPAGTLVTFFPPDAVCLDAVPGLSDNPDEKMIAVYGPDDDGLTEAERIDRIERYGMETWRPDAIMVAGNPNVVGDPEFLGHIVNDGAYDEADTFADTIVVGMPTAAQIRRMAVHYYRNTTRCNARYLVFPTGLVVLMTVRAVDPGEEITALYGLPYWVKRKFGELPQAELNTLLDRTMTLEYYTKLGTVLGINLTDYERGHISVKEAKAAPEKAKAAPEEAKAAPEEAKA